MPVTQILSVVGHSGGGGSAPNTYNSWTVEWFNKGLTQNVSSPRVFAVGGYPYESIGFSREGTDYVWVGSGPGIATVSSADNVWQHWAIVSDGTYLGIFKDGTRVYYDVRQRMVNDTSSDLYVGISADPTTGYTGYITNFRVVKNEAKYDPNQGSLTVPTLPLTSNSNTELLLLASSSGSTTTDSSSRSRTPWGQGGLAWSAETPFTAQGPYSAYSGTWGSQPNIDFNGSNTDLLNVKAGWIVSDGSGVRGTVTSDAYVQLTSIRIVVDFDPAGANTWTFTQPSLGGSIQFYTSAPYGYLGFSSGSQWALDVV